MLRSAKDLENYTIGATDGPLGHVKDFYFDDDAWVVRYLVVETGSWLSSRKVLISPVSVHQPDWLNRTLPLTITKAQVKNSPPIDTDKPVSRQHDLDTMGYYGYPCYWGGLGLWGDNFHPCAMLPVGAIHGRDRAERERENEAALRAERARHRNDDPHLRSCKTVVGYHFHATDGEIGHVSGYLLDDETWAIRYLIVDTGNWWIGHQVLIAPEWIAEVKWLDETVSVDMSRESVKAAPAYDSEALWSRELDRNLYLHHGRSGYWADSPMLAETRADDQNCVALPTSELESAERGGDSVWLDVV